MTSEEFNSAAARVKTLKAASNDDKLLLYSLFKQATVGDINIPKPGMFSLEGKAKWEAWKAKEGKSQTEAEAEYIEVVNKLMAEA